MLDVGSLRNALIVGYGVSGKSACEFLRKHGVDVSVYDDVALDIPGGVRQIPWDNIELVIKSPSVPVMPHNCHDVIKQANARGIPVISTFDLFKLTNPSAKIIAITGTNGKSTTTALIYHILKHAGLSVEMGGNIGIPYFELPKSDWYVLEMSSYELASSKYLSFEMAGILNIEPDHLSFHGDFANYVAAKHLALDNAKMRLISLEDTETAPKYAGKDGVIPISTDCREDADVYICENAIFDKSENRVCVDLSGIDNLPGKHNQQNIAFAYAVCRQLGIPPQEIAQGIRSFTPLPHRINIVRKIGNVTFVNDSKATNPGSAARALATFVGHKIYWLVGGRSKKTDPLPYVEEYLPEVQCIYLFGEAMDEFETAFAGFKRTVRCETMAKALHLASRDAARSNDVSVVLLSPMCASFDQFANFEERGNEFVRMVGELD